MGQKVNPCAYRLACNTRDDQKTSSAWFATGTDYRDYLHADIAARTLLTKEYEKAGISRIDIERPSQNAHVIIHCSRPGVIIGRKGSDIDMMRAKVAKMLNCSTHITVKEVKKPDLKIKKEIKKPDQKPKKEAKKPDLKVKNNNVAEVILPDLNLKTATVIQLFKDVDYDLRKVRNEKLVKPIYFTQLPRDLDDLQNVQLKKETFIKILLPLIVAENEKILDDREKLRVLSEKKFTTDLEKQWLRQKLLEYKVKKSDFNELKLRMDIIPISIALAQAA